MHVEPAPRGGGRWARIIPGAGALLLSLAIVGLVLVAKVKVEETDAGQWLRLATYDFLQHRLAGRPAEPRVAVLDLGGLPGTDVGFEMTPRRNLKAILEALASLRPPPKGVAFDIDFSPERPQERLSESDRDFFDACLKASGTMPVRLGIERSETRSPDAWLGAPRYRVLAANNSLPRESRPRKGTAEDASDRAAPESREELGVRSAPLWIRAGGGPDRCPGLAAALVGRPPVPAVSRVWGPLRWAVEDYSRVPPPGSPAARAFEAQEFLIDYSWLDPLEKRALLTFAPREIRRHPGLFQGKYVLVGDLQGPDRYAVPGRRKSEAGALIHACAAQTLLEGRPLLQFQERGRIAMDVALALLVLGLVSLTVSVFHRRGSEKLSEELLHDRVTWGVVAVVFVVAVFLVRATHLIWDDFILILIGLLAHRPLARWLTSAWEWLRRGMSRPLGRGRPLSQGGP